MKTEEKEWTRDPSRRPDASKKQAGKAKQIVKKKPDAKKTDARKQDAAEKKKDGMQKAMAKRADNAKETVKKSAEPWDLFKKRDAKKAEGSRWDAKKADAKKSDIKKADTKKNDIKKADTKKNDIKKADAKKNDIKKAGTGKNAAGKADLKKTEAGKALSADKRTEGFSGAKRTGEKRQTAAPGRFQMPGFVPKAFLNARKPVGKLKIIPLGGLEQIGMNITAFEYADSIIVVDCGLAFPSDDMLGVDLVIPDVTYLEKNIDKVKGFFITHGHEDHIGSLPYILKKINVPVYGTKLTIGLIENKLREHDLLKSTDRRIVRHGDVVSAGEFDVEFIKTNHSIADAAALAIFTPVGTVVHTGDFKIDYTPVFGDAVDLQRFAEIGRDGVLALMSDSTNAIRAGFTPSESTVGKTFDSIFQDHTANRIIVATFASNVDRVQQIINSAEKYGRKVIVEGRSMVNVITTASELGYISIPEGTLIDIESLKNYPDEQTVLITTGSQGESMAALSRMASGMHRKVSIKPTDVIVLSSTPIPGNEKAVSRVINELSAKGAKVIFQETHVSGHACAEEIKLMYALTKPKFALPVHGEYRHLVANREIAISMGVPKENTLIMRSGDVVELDADTCEVTDRVQNGGILVDGLGIGDVGNIVLRDRQNLAQDGIIVVVLTLEKYSNRLVSGPDIVSRGFVYVRESEDLMDEAQSVVDNVIEESLDKSVSDWGKLKNLIRDSLGDFIWKRMKRNPVILPIIMEAD